MQDAETRSEGLVRELFETLSTADPKVRIERMFSKGEWVAAETTASGKLSNGKDYDNRYAWMDTAYILQQLDMK